MDSTVRGVPAQSISDALYVPGAIPIARYDLGALSLTVNGGLNLVNGVGNGALNLLALVSQPFDAYSGELITLETAFPPSAIGVAPLLLAGQLSKSVRAATAVNAARATAGAVKEGTTVYRVFGGEARGLRQSWTTVNPATVSNFRQAAGLFPGNTGQFVIEGRLTSTEGVLFRYALPGPNGVGGGLSEVVIPNPGSQVCVLCVSGVNPPF